MPLAGTLNDLGNFAKLLEDRLSEVLPYKKSITEHPLPYLSQPEIYCLSDNSRHLHRLILARFTSVQIHFNNGIRAPGKFY